MVSKLILLRHGESEWNAKNLFTGWVDVNLSEAGVLEAKKGGQLLEQAQVFPDVAHTSLLRRAIMTANFALNEAGRVWIPVKRSWRLNERHYGALQGKDKKAIREEYGDEQFMQWRRSYVVPPPRIEADSEYSQSNDIRYKDAPEILSECLKDVLERVLPYWEDEIVPDLKAGKVVLVTAHGNSLRALVKYLENISDDDISGVNIPTGIPLCYELDDDFHILDKGKYLDPDAQAKIDAVANQGK
ncbi:MAG: phosphoglyceromutase [Candidatus Ancillula trichonymphae]|jgi:2,3-bisphosphoglycerate-dependent phosphoglycerate mutase|nr:phosphoglyceromutase [Candidatus Ancillula trichonymphae]